MSYFCLEFINTRLRTSFDINKINYGISNGDDEFDKVWSGMECFGVKDAAYMQYAKSESDTRR
ncbi:hypothetical protein VCRA2114E365_90027 [Vibrio crassostreae]|nr:hypothetical protein VCRA2113O354_100013 [Vibrio crassostreae]CAK1693353.1 hypothetical protein VCRA2113O199_100017 [Vibrio crassostreae]CAK1693849.1 hypothetical protein VCRA2115O371_100026 [Vibrio crassostreae]CAK1710472.1 hypothetical protein VCRA2117O376_100170 [Vibrio crassostreae]CAK1710616.1 hypothetical protein VCRA2113O358_100170 [Vibrio crassostreae]